MAQAQKRAPDDWRILVCAGVSRFDEILAAFGHMNVDLRRADDVADVIARIGAFTPDVIICSPTSLEDEIGPLVQASKCPVVIACVHADAYEAVRALREGASDYAEIGPRLVRAVEHTMQSKNPERVRPRWLDSERTILGRIVSRTKVMGDAVQRARDVAKTPNTTVLVLGETGSGKELIANAIHALSGRSHGPFVAVDCSAIPETLMESELFGHERGSFSGAVGERRGRVELADQGTLFLDEIGELPAAMQAKLLRVLEQREIWRVGASRPRPVDVRVVAATHRDLPRMVGAGGFRADLYYRLAVFEIRVPPLRERAADILHLAEHFLDRFCREQGRPPMRFSPEAAAKLVAHPFPGNVRELRNLVEQAMVSALGDTISVEHVVTDHDAPFLPSVSEPVQAQAPPPDDETSASFRVKWGDGALENLERQALERAIALAHGNLTHAAKLLGVGRQAVTRAILRHGLAVETHRGRPRVHDKLRLS
ncbi:MAG: sigma-54-dependent Fis family transcriptional regulator [Deltaproteobacteria bacterium]|nr:sigma-54-dependent Fis family transcriptional regulator [Deltaproteobacteria bacterium]